MKRISMINKEKYENVKKKREKKKKENKGYKRHKEEEREDLKRVNGWLVIGLALYVYVLLVILGV